ncbi:MAG: site-specific DNA-methyltransferase [Ilumatobacteraceae bacterium]|jgi:adenine-specific DNA-methyltransferase|nr:site-specific DNA-methyltransferase [Ilumatobacteraceae bacterium]
MPFLDWVNKAQAQRITADVPYHLLQFQSAHGDAAADNLLIQGDNLLALKALLPFYRGRVKCIFIDPPYNTQSAFEHYDDKLEHSQWLSMMWPRMVMLRDLLSEDGSIWITLDDNEAHYLKVLMDEVFGRNNFVANVVWEKSDSPKMDSQLFSTRHDHLLVFSKNDSVFKLKRLATETAAHYDKTDETGRLYYLKPLRMWSVISSPFGR